MITTAEAYEQGRKAVGVAFECPYEFEGSNERLHVAWWKGFDERCEEMEPIPERRYVSTEAHLHYYETRDY